MAKNPYVQSYENSQALIKAMRAEHIADRKKIIKALEDSVEHLPWDDEEYVITRAILEVYYKDLARLEK